MKKIFNKRSVGLVLCLIICAAFTAIYFDDTFTAIVYRGIDTRQVKISTGTEIGYAYDENTPVFISPSSAHSGVVPVNGRNAQTFEELKASIVANNGFVEYTDPITKVTGFRSTHAQSEIIFNFKFVPETAFTIYTSIDFAQGYVQPQNGEAYMTYFDGGGKQDTALVFPFRAQFGAYHYLRYIAIYVIAVTAIFALYFLIYLTISSLKNITNKLGSKSKIFTALNRKALFVIITGSVFALLSVLFILNPQNFFYGDNIGSDAYYYAHGPFYDENGYFSMTYFLQNAVLHRGLYQSFMYLFFDFLAKAISIDILYFHFLTVAVMAGFTFAYFMPMLYKAIFGKEINNTVILLVTVVFAVTWNGIIRYTLSDTVGCFLVFGAVAFFLRGMVDNKKRSFVYSGLLLSLALNWRASYSLVYTSLVIILAFVLAKDVYLYVRSSKTLKSDKTLLWTILKRDFIFLLLFVLAVAAVKVPQQILMIMGGMSPFMGTNIPWYTDYLNRIKCSIVEVNLQLSYTHYSNFTTQNLDKQMNNIYAGIYGQNENLQFKDIIYLWMNKPLDSFIMTLKRLVWSLRVDTSLVYGGSYSLLLSKAVTLFSSSMYITIAYTMFSRKLRKALYNSRYILFFGLAFITTVLSQAVLAVEIRYFIFISLIAIITFFAVIIPKMVSDNNVRKELFSPRFLISLTVANLAIIAFYETVLMNFTI